jgi:hypothetical protein
MKTPVRILYPQADWLSVTLALTMIAAASAGTTTTNSVAATTEPAVTAGGAANGTPKLPRTLKLALKTKRTGSLAVRRDASGNPLPVERIIEETGPHHKIWRSPRSDPPAAGTQTNVALGRFGGLDEAMRGDRVVEMATGMNYWDGQRWNSSDPRFEATPSGFAANRLQYQVALAQNLNAIGSVTLTTPDGLTLRSTPVGIGLYDAANGSSLLISELTDCSGVLLSSNKVVFENAFTGVSGDIIFTAHRWMFEQDVVLRQQVNPADYGFDPATTHIRIFTELYAPPKPERVRRPLRVEEDESVRRRMVTPDLVDEMLGF